VGVRDYLEILMFIVSITAVVTVGRNNIKKQIITDLQALVLSHQLTIDKLKKEGEEKDVRICELEETVDGYAELVRQGYLFGSSGTRSGNSSAAAKTTKNRTP
jgi:hypothetical protein